MQDAFTGKPTRIRGSRLVVEEERQALQDDHLRRLGALAHLRAAAAECGVRADSDRDFVLLAEDEVSLLEVAGGEWARLGDAIRAWRETLPLRRLEDFGFAADVENPLEEPNQKLRRIGGGVEAWAFASEADGSVYKFYLPREEKRIGSVFGFGEGDESRLLADAQLGTYQALLEKLALIQHLGGMATEVVAVTPEGVMVAKQTYGEPLAQGDDMSSRLPVVLIEIPSRFLRANRDHPRLCFFNGHAWLIGDLHARNFVRGADGGLYLIDLVASPWPVGGAARDPLILDWIRRVQLDPRASVLPANADHEL
jgi:hypothetical protein